ncbi:DUF4397 domain-containing protein [Haladaptatus sp. NG-SE-30]
MRGTRTTRTVAIGLVTLVLASSLAIGALAGGIGAMTGTDESQDDGDAQVRVAHMSPDAPPVDVLIDGETAVSNLSFGNVTDYATLSAGEHNVTITAAGDPSAVVFSDNISFEADTNFTIAATGEISEDAETTFEPVVFEDNFTRPGEGNASVRLLHVSPDAPPVDVTVEGTDTTLFDNVSFRNATEYVEVPAGDYTLEVRPATEDDDGEVVATFDVTLNESTAYSAFAAGYIDPEAAPEDAPDRPFELILVADFVFEEKRVTTPAETTPEETTPEETPTPEETTPEETPTPEETTPEETPTPEETTPEKTTPEKTTPEKTTPEETPTPEETTPRETPTPEKTTPEKTTPEETPTPEKTTPMETTTKTDERKTTTKHP